MAGSIRSAEQRIEAAVFHFTSPWIEAALKDRARAGVRVRLLLDAAQADEDLVRRLREAGVSVRRALPADPEGRFHHKFAVFDAKLALTGSYNWTVRGAAANHENAVWIRAPGAVRAFLEEFERTWDDPSLSRP